MPTITKNYDLTSFVYGDPYSAKADKRRFYTIDTQTAFISDLVGNGVIDGWGVIDSGSNSPSISESSNCNGTNLKLSEGSGIIDREYARTFGTVDIPDVTTFPSYIYVTKTSDLTFPFSGFSLNSILASNFSPPVAPTGLTVMDSTYNSITLSWANNIEPDLSRYVVEKSLDGISYDDSITTTTNSYIDEDVEENTIYYYRILAQNLSGQEGAASAIVNVTTPIDLTVPENPAIIMTLPGDSFIQISWQPPSNSNVNTYRVDIFYLGEDQTTEYTVDSVTTSDNTVTINDLDIGKLYKIYLYSVSTNSVSSSGVSMISSLVTNPGPNEIYDLSIYDTQSSNNDRGVNLDVSWMWDISPYYQSASKFLVYVIENSNFVSDPIEVFNYMETNSFSVDIENYTLNGLYREILPDKYYIILVKAVDEFGNMNAGIIKDITTGRFFEPSSPSSVVATLKNEKDLLFTWKNSTDNFSYNLISITKTNLTTSVVTNVLTSTNIGSQKFYLVESPLDFNSTYTLTIKCFDNIAARYSQEIEFSYTTVEETTVPIDVPKFQYALNGDRQVFLGWTDSLPNTSKFFKIWRAIYKNKSDYSSSDFTLIDTINKINNTYVDYTVINDIKYIYFITTVDIYDHESLNPVDDNFITYPYIFATPHENSFDEVSDIIVQKYNVYDVLVSWDAATDDFDGWEIYKSINNKYSWEKINSVDADVLEYLDSNALLVNGYTYYYMVRKYKNEAEAFVSTSNVLSNDYILIAKVTCEDNSLDITDLSTNIKDVADVVQDFLTESLDKQHHLLSDNADSRIDLKENVIISDWTTVDNKTYTTEQDFSGGTSYIAYIDGVVSTLFYEVDTDNKQIIFSNATDSQDVSLECIGARETTGVFKANRLQDELYTKLINSGKILTQQLPSMPHDGRKREALIPLQIPLETQDGYNFESFQSIYESFGNALTFYDITNLTAYSNDLIAATSKGMYISSDTGFNWTQTYLPDGIVHKIFHSTVFSSYIALGNKDVYYSKDGEGWTKINGLDNISAVRDIAEDNFTIYITTNAGIYSIDTETLLAEHVSFVSPAVSDCYGLFYDSIEDDFIVSTDAGLFKSFGVTSWVNIDSKLIKCPFYDFIEDSSYIFAVSDCGIFRSTVTNISFDLIAYIDAESSRKINIFDDNGTKKLVVLSDNGVQFSGNDYNIYTDLIVDISDNLIGVNDEKGKCDITSLNIINNAIFAGSDGKLFMASSNKSCRAIYDETSSTGFLAPTIFVDNEKNKIGVYYDLVNNLVYFDRRVSDISTVGIANQYKIFRSQNSGWANEKYDSSVEITINGEVIKTFSNLLLSDVISSWGDVVFPDMTEYTANLTRAQEYISDFNTNMAELSLVGTEPKEEIVQEIWNNYDQACKQFISPVKFYSELTINTSDYYIFDFFRILQSQSAEFYNGFELVQSLPDIYLTTSNVFDLADASNGIFVFASALSKYDDPRIDLSAGAVSAGTYTHEYLEDSVFENINSGLPAALAVTQQSNLVNSITFIQNTIGNINNTIYNRQLSHLAEADDLTVSEYDTFNSTIDYIEEVSNNNTDVLKYITSVGYFNSTVLLGSSSQGLWSLDTDSLEIDKIDIFNYNNIEYIVDIKVDNNKIYILTDYKILWSSDLETWNSLSMKDINDKNLSFLINGDIILLATEGGLYRLGYNNEDWTLISDQYTLISNILYMHSTYYIVNNNILYFSFDTASWSNGGAFGEVYVNGFTEYLSLIAVSTSNGLRYNNATFTTGAAQLSLVDILDNADLSLALKINFILANDDDLFAFASDGKYYSTSNGTTFVENESNLPGVKYAKFIDGVLWIFNHNSVKIGTGDPIRISKGIGIL